MPLSSATLACTLLLAWPHAGRAQAATRGDGGDTEQNPSAIEISVDNDPARSPSGAVLLGSKLGGIELGYMFPALNHGLGALLQVEYSVPAAEGSMDEPFAYARVPSGYRGQLLQKELVLQPTFLYRMTSLFDSITPFVGVGLRVCLLESITTVEKDDQIIEQTTERSTELGGGLPIGAEFALGPGALTGEVMLHWGPLKRFLTGATHRGGVSAFAGYRMLL